MTDSEIVKIPHHIKALTMKECKECEYYVKIDKNSFYCKRRAKTIKHIK